MSSGIQPNVTSAQGDSLNVSTPFVAEPDQTGLYVFCSRNSVVPYGGSDIAFCAYVSLYDSVTGSTTTTNNSQSDSVYDACGTLIGQTSTYDWQITGSNPQYMASGYVGSLAIAVPTYDVCFGTWSVSYTYSQTFTDGDTLSQTATATFTVYPSLAIADGIAGGDSAVHDPTCNSRRPVNCASGDFWHTFTDVKVPGRGVALDLSRTYNSLNASTQGIFGYGWSSTYDMNLVTYSDGSVTITSDDGSQVTATPSGSGYSVPTWDDSTLSHNSDGTWTFVRHQTQTYAFSSSGQLTSISDPNGYVTSLSYTNGKKTQLSTVTDPEGRTIGFSFGRNGLVSQVTDPAGQITKYGYDSIGELTSVTDPMGRKWQFGYDPSGDHLLETMNEPNYPSSDPLVNVYDAYGRVTRQTDYANLVTTFAYSGDNFSSSGGTTTITDPHGNVEVEDYVNGQLQSLTKGYGTASASTWNYAYDQNTLGVTSLTDPNNHTTRSLYDQYGNLTSTTDAFGDPPTTYTYNALDEPHVVTDPMGITTTYTYDSSGNLQTKAVTGIGGSPTETTYYDYGDSHPGDVTKVTDPDGHVTNFTYDSYGDVASATTNPSSSVSDTTQYVYDVLGREVCEASPNANAAGVTCPAAGQPRVADTTTRAYDADNELTSLTDPLGNTTRYSYDSDRNQIQVTDPSGNVTKTAYDKDDRKSSVTNGYGSSAAATTSYAYDLAPTSTPSQSDPCSSAVSAVTYCSSSTDPDSNVTVDYFDAQDRRVEEIQPSSGTAVDSYDPAGNLSTQITPTGTASYGYDADNRLTSITYSNPTGGASASPNVRYIYDADSQRTQMTDGTGTTLYHYDSLERLQSSTNGAGSTTGYGYDSDNNVTTLTYPNSKSVSYGYDNAGHVTSVGDWLGHTTNYGYDSDSNANSEALPNGINSSSTFDNSDQLSATSDSPSPIAFSYVRNADGLVTSETDTGTPGTGSQSYSYDQLNRLVSSAAGTYSYDPASNLTSQPGASAQGYNSNEQLCYSGSSSGTCSSPPAGSSTYSYDGSGDRTLSTPPSSAATSYGYNQAGELTSVSQPGNYTPLPPTRIIDTRANSGYADSGDTLGPDSSLTIQLGGAGGIPSSGAGAAVVRITVAGPSEPGALTVYPAGASKPLASALNFAAGQVIGNEVTAKLGTNGQVVVYNNSAGNTNIVVDVYGYALASSPPGSSSLTAIDPVRVADTRSGSGEPYAGDTLAPGGTLTVQVAGVDGIPSQGLSAASLNVTVVNTTEPGNFTVYAAGSSLPSGTTGAFLAGQVVNSGVTTSLGTNGAITIYNGSTGTADFIVDVDAYYTDGVGSGLVPLTPARIADTRTGSGEPYAGDTLQSHASLTIQVAGEGGVPSSGASAAVLAIGVVNDASAGFLTVYPSGSSKPNTAANDFPGNAAIVNDEVTVGLSSTGAVTIWNGSAGSVDLVVDVEGYYTAPAGTYTYNGDGLRMSKTANGAATEAFSWDMVTSSGTPELLADNSTYYVYGSDGLPLEQITSNGTVLYYLHDQLGSTRAVTSSSGSVLMSYTYSPFGQLVASSGSLPSGDINPFGFAGAYTDAESGLIYLVNRYYDPATGQFLSVDPAVDLTQAAYDYAYADPVNVTDRTGLGCGIFSFVCGAVSYVVKNPLQSLAIAGAAVATVATDGATSGLLVDSISVAITEDTTAVVVEGSAVDIASETSTLGRVAGYAAYAAAAGQTGIDCADKFNGVCVVDFVTLGLGFGVQFLDISDMQRAFLGLASTLVPPFYCLAERFS